MTAIQNQDGKLKIHITYREMEIEAEGGPNEVFSQMLDFLKKVYPGLELISKIQLTVDTRHYLETMDGIVAVQPTGPVILIDRKLTTEEQVSLLLSGAYLGSELKLLPAAGLTLDDLIRITGKTEGTLTGTLSRMKEKQLVERIEGHGYKVTPFGLRNVAEKILPKLKNQGGKSKD